MPSGLLSLAVAFEKLFLETSSELMNGLIVPVLHHSVKMLEKGKRWRVCLRSCSADSKAAADLQIYGSSAAASSAHCPGLRQ